MHKLMKSSVSVCAVLVIATSAVAATTTTLHGAIPMERPPRISKSEFKPPEGKVKRRAVTPEEYDAIIQEAAELFEAAQAEWIYLQSWIDTDEIADKLEASRSSSDLQTTSLVLKDPRGGTYEFLKSALKEPKVFGGKGYYGFLPRDMKQAQGQVGWRYYDPTWRENRPTRSVNFDLTTSTPESIFNRRAPGLASDRFLFGDRKPWHFQKYLDGGESVHMIWNDDGTLRLIWHAEEREPPPKIMLGVPPSHSR